MLNKSDACRLVSKYLEEIKVKFKLKIIDEATIEQDFGWVFFYTIDSDDENVRLGGNGPLIVDKDLEKVFQAGSRLPIEDYISLYKKYRGDEEGFKKSMW